MSENELDFKQNLVEGYLKQSLGSASKAWDNHPSDGRQKSEDYINETRLNEYLDDDYNRKLEHRLSQFNFE